MDSVADASKSTVYIYNFNKLNFTIDKRSEFGKQLNIRKVLINLLEKTVEKLQVIIVLQNVQKYLTGKDYKQNTYSSSEMKKDEVK